MATFQTRAFAGQTKFSIPTATPPTSVTVNGTATTAFSFNLGHIVLNSGLAQGDTVVIVYTDPVVSGGGSGSGFSGNYNDLSNKPTLGTAASKATGTSAGNVPLIQTGGLLDPSIIPGVKNNLVAILAPTATDDANLGYSTGSSWLNILTGDMWRCRDATATSAKWIRVDTADHPGYIAGNKYLPFGHGSPTIVGANAANTIYLAFGVIKQRITVSQLGARLTTAATGNFQLAIYAHNAQLGVPGALIVSTGSGSTGSAAVVNLTLAANKTIEPGGIWVAVNQDNASAVFMALGLNAPSHISLIGVATGDAIPAGTSNASQTTGLSTSSTFGTWPADLSNATFALSTIGRNPIIQFLVASVP